ncbi:MAG: pyridoxal-phosphate dependent enzyme [Deltaproteobacteria bacterium]|nr:pyridoxal-phosphate dependent enzyme [Deltaproteobacteria bacterium]
MRIPLASTTLLSFAEHVSRALGRDVFVKRDNATHPRYGGNKVRKLEYLLADARRQGATDLVTMGAVGSHHVLATTIHGRGAGFQVEAVLTGQPYTPHVERNVRADLAQGATLYASPLAASLPLKVAARVLALRLRGRVPYVIPFGGSTPQGARGYIDAVAELRQQLSGLGFPTPGVMVVALGSGGTHAGLLAGCRLHGVASEVWGVRVTERWMSPAPVVSWLASHALHLAAPEGKGRGFSYKDILVVDDQRGEGYGHPTDEARRAQELFARDDVGLDLTYTAKAAAGLLQLSRGDVSRRPYLFWNTLSSAPVEALIPDLTATLPRSLEALLGRG